MKHYLLFLFLIIIISFSVFGQDNSAAMEQLEEFLPIYLIPPSSKILEDGVQLDSLLGVFYNNKTRKTAGEVRLRYIKTSANDVFLGVDDSLITISNQVFEVFLLPINYHFFRNKNGFSFSAGAGVYYDFNKLNENGFLNDGELYEPPLEDHYSAYTGDFTGHAVGPLIDIGIEYSKSIFRSTVSFGCVPIFYFDRNQTRRFSPFMNPNPSYTVSSSSFPGPYFYVNLDLEFNIKIISLDVSLLYEYSNLKYMAAGFDKITGEWADVEEKLENNNLALEISLLFNLEKTGFRPKIGYGRTFTTLTGGSNYIILGGVLSGIKGKRNDEERYSF